MGSSLVLLPTYNERDNLPRIVPRLSELREPLDLLVLDDASPDGTGELAEELRGRYPRMSVLHRERKEGLGRAYVHGFKEALRRGYRRVVTMDADLSHAPQDVPRLLWALEEADVAVGSRHAPGGGVRGWPLRRNLLSRWGSLYARVLLGLPASDVTSGFRAYRAEALKELDLTLLRARGFAFQVEILRRILDLPGARCVEVPITFQDRTFGASKLSRGIVLEAIWEVAKLALRRRQAPRRAYGPLGATDTREPKVTVVIPARPECAEPESLRALSDLDYSPKKLEVFLARGRSPSRQRNEAVARGSGELILFLDDDSLPAPEILSRYARALGSDPTLAAVGGPAEALPGSAFQALATLLLSEPWVVGKTASRYAPRGSLRYTDERELILCNLCLRRRAFEEAGGFSLKLYPNEENELLERLRRRGWRLLYDPRSVVRRPERASLGDLLSSIQSYGTGRAAQLKCLPSRVSLGRLLLAAAAALAALIAGAALSSGSALGALPPALYALYLAALSARLSLRAGLWKGLLGAALTPLIHGSYALGVLRGLFRKPKGGQEGEVAVEERSLSQEEVKRRSVA